MGKNSRIVLAVICAALLGVFGWQMLRPSDEGPVYQGKSLSKWLEEVGPNQALLPSAVEALQQMGTNAALPWLLKEASLNHSVLLGLARELLQKQPVIKFHFAPLPDHQARALRGFRVFGAAGAQTIAQGLSDPDKWIRNGCVGQWEMCKDYPDLIFPALLKTLNDPSPMVRGRAANAVGMLHLQPDKAVPALIAMLSDQDDRVRSMGALGLSLYGTNARPAVPILLKLLADPSHQFEFFGTNALRDIDPSALAKLSAK